MGKVIGFLRARLNERSTYAFILTGLGSVTGLPVPFNWIGFAVLVTAGLVPDGPVKTQTPDDQ